MKKVKEFFNKKEDIDKTLTKKKIILGICILGALLITTGTALAFYIATVTGEGKKIQGKTAFLDIDFADTEDVNATLSAPIYDKDSATKAYKNTFTIENTSAKGSNVDAEYDVYLSISQIDPELKSEYMKYELLKDGEIISSGNLQNATTTEDFKLTTAKELIALDSDKQELEFRLWMSYSDTTDQMSMLNKSITAKLKVKANETITAASTIIAKYSENNTEGLIKVEQPATDQMKATTEYRYSGSDVNNYVNFNNETWRIIGVFEVDDGDGNYERRVKIIKDSSIGYYSWDSSASDVNSGYGINQWGESEDASGNAYSGADLKTLLNLAYYNKGTSTCYNDEDNANTECDFSETGLSDTARNMIDDAKWYTGGVESGKTTPATYTEERSNALPPTGEEYSSSSYNDTVIRKGNWTGKVALLYPSDYGYASSSCYNTDTTLYYYEECTDSNWLSGDNYWTLSPLVSDPNRAFYVDGDGYVYIRTAYIAYGVRPVTYLKSGVKITGGTGENAENAYELSL